MPFVTLVAKMLSEFLDFRNRNLLAGRGAQDTLLILLVVLVGVASFGLGRFSAQDGKKEGVILVENKGELEASASGAIPGGVVASKTGSKYHLPWCAGAQTIREGNKIWFESAAEARRAGYEPAGNCKGIE